MGTGGRKVDEGCPGGALPGQAERSADSLRSHVQRMMEAVMASVYSRPNVVK